MKLILGLGNPGKKYQNTRHNIGFAMLDFIFDNWLKDEGFSNWSENKKFQAIISEGKIDVDKIIFAKPTTYMNNSGQAIQSLMAYYQVEPKNLLVIHDELDLTFGNYKIQSGKSSAGHKGIESIVQHIKTQDFTRIRVGISKEDKQKQGDTAKFVLHKFGLFERIKLKELKERVLKEIKQLIS